MKIELVKTFPIAAGVTAAWEFLQDIPGVAGCMPGAEITESVDDAHYKGRVKVKIGPAAMAFNGTIEIKGIDSAKKQVHLIGSGQDTKGSSSAAMDLTAWVADTGNGNCELNGKATVSMTGKAASLGGRMMTQVSDQILSQFGKNFADQVLAMGEGEATKSAREALAERPKELNGLVLMWKVLVGMFKKLLGGHKTSET
ncbi:MAG: carbon monoxide dehydrogenase [Gammaproteobacteria bacterium HGW-Gammaproteobacteria-3]|nr:MAG: carbon monoxide dehydrogenase [Gammaproteobacteria bacterium HGW-Gammaproteobacteria-3]